MATAAMTLGWRPRPRLGPALRRFQLPYRTLALSASVHLALAVAIVVGAAAWRASQPRTYVVNLVPAVAAVGVPQGRPTPSLPPRALEPATRAVKPQADEPPAPAPAMPPRARESAGLPERSLPSRVPALPRPGDKELPAVASAAAPRSATPSPSPSPTATAPRREAPVPPQGSPTGSPQGAGTVTLNVADFPYVWYIQAIHRKIQERWQGRAIEGRQPEIIFEIERNGQLRRVAVGKTSGNPAYDHLALRAISEASPFPELPKEFEKPTLTVGLQFIYDPNAR